MYKRILLPTDGSDASLRAIRHGVEFARTLGAEVLVLTATPEFHTFTADAAMIELTLDEYEKSSAAQAARLLDEACAVARAAGVPCSSAHLMCDHPYEAIIRTAREQRCDLIVMASHGRRGIKGLLLGSETHKVLVHSAIPVMVYR
jgi:nucleotide-binding universal stress UspA family protein